MRVRSALVAGVVALASCAPVGWPQGPEATRASVAAPAGPLPALRRFEGAPRLTVPAQPNGQLARDFMALTFLLESGREVPTFTRFEGPITVAVETFDGHPVPPTLDPDLSDLIGRLRREARIDIRRAAPGEMGSITVTALPRAELQRAVPGAACFVVPRVAGWQDYLSKRSGPATDWTTLDTRRRASVFVPADVSPQEIRDCLHEEVAQALGPLNDLYRLPWSVFNDDNTHAVLTSYDMLILRATYDGALASGQDRATVARALPAVLDRINPAGRGPDRVRVAESDPAWTTAIRAATAASGSDRARLRAANRALEQARAAGWTDERLALSLLARGRAAMTVDPEIAIASFLDAGTLYRQLDGEGVAWAQAAMQQAAVALAAGQPGGALAVLDRAIPAAEDAQNASLLATLLLMRAEAVRMQGDGPTADRIRQDGLAWGRYAWGDQALAGRAAEVAGLGPGA